MTLDLPAIVRGAVIAGTIALPVAVFAQLLDGRDRGLGDSVALALFAVVLLAFGVGGHAAARSNLHYPLSHGALAAALAFAAIQGIGILLRLASGRSLSLVSIIFNGLLAASCGMAGGLIAWRRAAPAPRRPGDS